MKFFVCLLILGVVNSGLCQGHSEEILQNIKLNIHSYLERRRIQDLSDKVENICPGYGYRIEGVLKKVQQCWNSHDLESETMCSIMKNHFEQCANPITELLEECLPERSRDIPDFIAKSIVSVSNHLCKADGEHIFELSNSCIRTQSYRSQRCMRKIQTKMQQYNNKTPTKQEACEFLRSFRGCLQSHITASCNNEKTRESFLGVYDAATSMCGSNTIPNEIENDEWESVKVDYQ